MVVGSAAAPVTRDARAEHDDGVGPGLPTPRIAAALVLGVLAFGVIVGNAAGPGATAADAGGRANVTILAAAPVAPAPVPAAPAPVTTTPQPDRRGRQRRPRRHVVDLADTGIDDTATDTAADTSSTR